MRALTVRQPYADAIAHGAKPVENRTKPLPPKYAGVSILLHAAKDPHATRITATDLAEFTGADITPWTDTRSAILAQIRFRGSHLSSDDTWCCRPWGQVPTRIQPVVWHWEIDQVILLNQPVPASGALSFWTPDDAVLTTVQGQIDLIERASA
ncbi:hypothetical protein [Streptomyces sp. NBC_00847]|uniref:hypothetical protein n=1 Tax=Streptomyces sp. NBC_00847 TaxID=2975850 RepID=UPI00225E252C|nr:hypothetical protein [Streptomyces sp. NBC_00847]MCX4885915.1 hypothetical protein [Streptomyces sp. NBC_00847]